MGKIDNESLFFIGNLKTSFRVEILFLNDNWNVTDGEIFDFSH